MLTHIRGAFERLERLLFAIMPAWTKSTLVVVDMQPEFFPAIHSDVLEQVARQIKRARRLGRAIVFLETKPQKYGQTFPRLVNLVDGYERVAFTRKRGMDGSRAILKICRRRGYDCDHFNVCGVYTHYCVEETVIGLGLRRCCANIRVIQKACDDPGGNYWHAFPVTEHVFLV